MMVYCELCNKLVNYTIKTHTEILHIEDDESITLTIEAAYCDSCGEEVHVPEVTANNIQRVRDIIKGGMIYETIEHDS